MSGSPETAAAIPHRGGRVVSVTSVRDGREHLVPEEVMTVDSAGRYPAVCGELAWAAALAGPPGPPCPRCRAARSARRAGARAERPGWWARLRP